jgi:hypothetical protein
MGTKTNTRALTQPNYYRQGVNSDVAVIPAMKIVQMDTATADGIKIATAVGNILLGVTDIDIAIGEEQSYQRTGKARVLAGAAFNRGDKLTTDGSGRAIVSTTPATDGLIGRAWTAATGANDIAEVELDIQLRG